MVEIDLLKLPRGKRPAQGLDLGAVVVILRDLVPPSLKGIILALHPGRPVLRAFERHGRVCQRAKVKAVVGTDHVHLVPVHVHARKILLPRGAVPHDGVHEVLILLRLFRDHVHEPRTHVAVLGVETARLHLHFLNGRITYARIRPVVASAGHRQAVHHELNLVPAETAHGKATLETGLQPDDPFDVRERNVLDLLGRNVRHAGGHVALHHGTHVRNDHLFEAHRLFLQHKVQLRGQVDIDANGFEHLGSVPDERGPHVVRAGADVHNEVVSVRIGDGALRRAHDGHIDAWQRFAGSGFRNLTGYFTGLRLGRGWKEENKRKQ